MVQILTVLDALLHEFREPIFALLDETFIKCQLNREIVARARVLEANAVASHVAEVLFGFFRRRRAQTFVVLDLPRVPVGRVLLPLFEFGHRVEALLLRLTRAAGFFSRSEYFYDRRDELFHEAVFQQIRPLIVNKVYY